MRTLIVSIFVFCATTLLAQQATLRSQVAIPAGTYSCEEILEILQQQGIVINHSTGSLNTTRITLNRNSYPLQEILEKLFDPARYLTMEKDGKILIIPISSGPITISGYVEDVSSHERLIGVNVFIPELQIGTTTNKFGFYSISLKPPADSVSVSTSYIGYAPQDFRLSSQFNHKLDITLYTQKHELSEVTVTDDNMRISNTQMSQIRLTNKELKGIPAFFGEEDILKVVQLLPGVQSGGEGGVNYIVRGGGPDQNLILLDGVPVYNVSHLFGYFSVFNIDAVKNVQFTKGGFPARFGGRLSSVLEIDMKEGDMERFHGAGSIGLLAAKLSLEGPIVKNKASFMVSARRTYFDLFYRSILDDEEGLGYYFQDFNAKINYKFSRKDRLYLSFYTGKDKLFSEYTLNDDRLTNILDYGNLTGALRWNHLYSEKLFSNLTATYTKYDVSLLNSIKTPYEFDGQEYFSRIEDYGLKYDLDYSLSSRHYLKIGGSYTYHIFKPGAIQYSEADVNAERDSLLAISPFTYSNDAYVYVEDDWKIANKWRLNAGLHYSAYFVESSFFHSLQPRVAMRYLLQSDWSLKASYSYMQQYVHLLTNSRVGLPTDLWVSSTDKIAPQRSHQWALGSTKDLWEGRFELTSEVFYKYMTDLITFKEGTLFSTAANWQDQVTGNGTGNSYGWEIFLKKKQGKTTGWIAYTLSRSTRQFDDVNNGKLFPYKYDRTHDLKLIVDHNFNERFNVALAFLYNTGIRATVPTSTFTDIDGEQRIIYSERNAYTYPDYDRLDISFNWKKKKRWGESMWTVALYNAYGRQNPYYIYFESEGDKRKAYQLSVFPILPSFSYSFTF